MNPIQAPPKRALLSAIPVAVILFFLPLLITPYHVTLLAYGLILSSSASSRWLCPKCSGASPSSSTGSQEEPTG